MLGGEGLAVIAEELRRTSELVGEVLAARAAETKTNQRRAVTSSYGPSCETEHRGLNETSAPANRNKAQGVTKVCSSALWVSQAWRRKGLEGQGVLIT